MAIVLYGKNGSKQIMKGHVDFEGMEKNGWYRNPNMIPEDEPIEETSTEEPEEETTEDPETIRQLAKDEGIEGWDKKRIKTLKKELNLD